MAPVAMVPVAMAPVAMAPVATAPVAMVPIATCNALVEQCLTVFFRVCLCKIPPCCFVALLPCCLVALVATIATLIEIHRGVGSPNRPTQTRRFAFIDETFGPISDVIRDLPSIMVTYGHNLSHAHHAGVLVL
jgi:hypothetical protein